MGTEAAKVPVAQAKASTAARASLSRATALTVQRQCACGGSAGPSGQCSSCDEKKKKEMVQRKAAGGAGPVAPGLVNSVIAGPGRPLDSATRSTFEPRFGTDFSGVRVHAGSRAAESARAVNAHAYTVGRNIVFNSGKYSPSSPGGRRLLAHELAHTIQHGGLQRSPSAPLEVSPQYSALERQADHAASETMNGSLASSIHSTGQHQISRQVMDSEPVEESVCYQRDESAEEAAFYQPEDSVEEGVCYQSDEVVDSAQQPSPLRQKLEDVLGIENSKLEALGIKLISVGYEGESIGFGVSEEDGKRTYYGRASVHIDPFDPTELDFSYTDNRLTLHGLIGFYYKSLHVWFDGNFLVDTITWKGLAADGTLGLEKGDVSITLDGSILESGEVEASGSLGYQLTPSLRTTAAIAVSFDKNMVASAAVLTGRFDVTEPINLMDEPLTGSPGFTLPILKKSKSKVFIVGGIPIPVKATGKVRVGIEYKLGPAVIDNLFFEGSISLLDEEKDFNLKSNGNLSSPVDLFFTIGPEISVVVGIPDVLFIKATMVGKAKPGLKGTSNSSLTLEYQDHHFAVTSIFSYKATPAYGFTFTIDPSWKLVPDLYLKLWSFYQKIGLVGPSTQPIFAAYAAPKPIEVYDVTVEAGPEIGFEAPFKYEFDKKFEFPSIDESMFIFPDIDYQKLKEDLIGGILQL